MHIIVYKKGAQGMQRLRNLTNPRLWQVKAQQISSRNIIPIHPHTLSAIL